MSVIENVYLYRFNSHGQLLRDIETYEGKIYGPRCSSYQFMCQEGGFSFKCSGEEGELLYGNLWLREPDLDKAKELYVKNQREKIKVLRKRIAEIEYDILTIQ